MKIQKISPRATHYLTTQPIVGTPRFGIRTTSPSVRVNSSLGIDSGLIDSSQPMRGLMTFALVNIPLGLWYGIVAPYYWMNVHELSVVVVLLLTVVCNGLMLRTLSMDPGIIPKIVSVIIA